MMLLDKFNNLDKRQKILVALLGVAIIILIWQLCSLFTSSSVPAVTARPVAKVMHPSVANNVASTAGATTAVDPATNSQAEYLRLVNEYQMAQLQRMIAEDNEAIAVAKRNAAQAMSDTVGMAGGSLGSEDSTDNNQAANVYSLVYTGQQNDGQWTATLKKNGQTSDVVAGRQLPDGAQVLSIDENGVLLNQANNAGKILVTFSGVTAVEKNISVQQTVVAPKPVMKPVVIPVKTVPITKPAPVVAVKPVIATKPAVVAKPVVKQKPVINKQPAVVKAIAPTKNTYTIQLTMDRELASVQGFIADHKLQDKAKYVRIKTTQGNERYLGLYGQYATQDEAQKALEALPATVRSEGAYVIASDSIHVVTK